MYGFGASYTDALLRRLCKLSGVDIVDENIAEMFFVSMCDPFDIRLLLIRAKI